MNSNKENNWKLDIVMGKNRTKVFADNLLMEGAFTVIFLNIKLIATGI